MEVINHNNVLAKFYDRKGNQIEWDNIIEFEIKMNKLKI